MNARGYTTTLCTDFAPQPGARMTRHAAAFALFAASALAILPGCYKSQYETEKTRGDDLEKKSKEAQSQVDALKRDLGAAQTRSQQLETQLSALRAGGSLVGFVDGKPTVREPIRWDGTQWVRHGDCARSGGTVKFENGRLADQTIMFNQPGGKPWYTGAIKFGKPDGEWIWFDDAGKPLMHEVWAAGRLAEVGKATTAKGPVTWSKLAAKERDAWVKTTATALRDLPELSRDTTPPPPPAAESPAPAKTTPATPIAAPKKPVKSGH